jgi:hypothetical protein
MIKINSPKTGKAVRVRFQSINTRGDQIQPNDFTMTKTLPIVSDFSITHHKQVVLGANKFLDVKFLDELSRTFVRGVT